MTNRRSGSSGISTLVIGLTLGASLVATRPAAAQSTIFNIPTTDTVAPKKGYFEFDYLPQLPAPDEGQFQVFTPRIVVGITPKIEAGANFGNVHYADDGGTDASIQPNVKYKFYANDDKGLAASAGVVAVFPMNHRDDLDDFALVYGNVSKKLKSGARFTAGPYGLIAKKDSVGTRGGVLLGYEQPVVGTMSFVADWFSSKNFFGYFTPGISVVLPHNGLLNIGYSIGNDSFEDGAEDYRNRALFVYYGITFP